MENALMTVKELAAYVNMSEPSIYRLIESKQIPYKRIGHSVRFDKNEINEWMSKEAKNAKNT